MEISRIYFHDFSDIESEFLVFPHCADTIFSLLDTVWRFRNFYAIL